MPRTLHPLAASLVAMLLHAGCLASCPTAEDAEAKARIFGPEEPPKSERLAKETLDPDGLATDPAMRRRILRMSAAEVRHRLGDFQAVTEVEFVWTRGRDRISLSERAELDQASSGDFRVKIDNDQDFGMELRYVDGVVYVKSRHGKFRERRSDRAGHEAWREEALAQLRTFFELFDGKVSLANVGTGSRHGRGVVRYAVALSEESDPALLPDPKPDWASHPVYPKNGPDPALRHRMAVFEAARPESVRGEIQVDRLSGVVVAFDLEGRLSVPSQDEDAAEAGLTLRIERDVRDIGRRPEIDVPEHAPFAPRPRAVKDPLAFWPPYVKAHPKEAPDDRPGKASEAAASE